LTEQQRGTLLMLIAIGALALSAGANAADIQTAVSAVQAHTDRADAALDRAVALFETNSDRKARVAFAKSRKEMGLAKAAAAKARRQVDTPAENTQAALRRRSLGPSWARTSRSFQIWTLLLSPDVHPDADRLPGHCVTI